MDNLTVHLKVVGREIAGIHLLPGWHTIVLRQEKTGRTVRHTLQPGEKPDRKLWEKLAGDSAYISIPVTNDNHLRHEFHAAVDHVSPGHAFDAFFILDFSVSSQQKVALQWAEDPVRKVEMEIRRVLNGITSAAIWAPLYEQTKQDGAVRLFQNEVTETVDRLQPLASNYGLHIDRIRMKLRLSGKDAQPDEKEAEFERSKRITETDKQERIIRTTADHQVKLLETHNAADIKMIEKWGEVRAGAAGHIDTALGNIAQNTKTGAELRRNVEMIQGLALSSGVGSGSGQTSPGSRGPQLPGSGQLLAAPGENRVASVVTQLCQTIESFSGDPARKRELLSASLHLLAEACTGTTPSESDSTIKTKVAELLSEYALTSEQFGTFRMLSDQRFLQEMLAPAAASSVTITSAEGLVAAPSIGPEKEDTEATGTLATAQSQPLGRRVDSDTRFSCLCPRVIRIAGGNQLLAYVFAPSARKLVDEDAVRRRQPRAEGQVRSETGTLRALDKGAEIVALPELPGISFDPPKSSAMWSGDWHSFEFGMAVNGLLPGDQAFGAIRFYVGPLQIAEIKLSVSCESVNGNAASSEDNSDAWAEGGQYQAIFVSYSHEDSEIVNRLEQAYLALGMDFLRDSRVLRSGVRWNEALLRKIDEADIFQLCWSSRARESHWVAQEWKYALSLNRPCFVRPLYWEKPMPQPPAELGTIHFAYLGW